MGFSYHPISALVHHYRHADVLPAISRIWLSVLAAWHERARLQRLAHARQIAERGTQLRPGELCTVFGAFALAQDRIQLGGHAGECRGRRRHQGLHQLLLSVGGGNLEKNVSPNLVNAIQLAKRAGASVVGIVGRDGGYTAKEATAAVIVPTVNPAHVTPHSEAFQAVIWHLFVSHPKLKVTQTKWESTK